MPVIIAYGDITKLPADAIVNAAKSSLLGGGGVDGAIHHAAGKGLLEECRTLGGCPTGEARITGGYDMPCRHIIHTVGPVWHGGDRGEPEQLASCYRESLRLAEEHDCRSVNFPLISSGIYGYPKDLAMGVALDAIGRYLSESDSDITVTMVIYDRDSVQLDPRLRSSLSDYIREHCFDRSPKASLFRKAARAELADFRPNSAPLFSSADSAGEEMCCEIYAAPDEDLCCATPTELDDRIAHLDESFSQTLLRLIDASGMTDAQCYKRANIDRKLFSKIRGDIHYRPSKPTAIAFAIALRLNLEQTGDLLLKAGYALSPSSKFDVIIRYFIERGEYNILRINEALFSFDQALLGA